MEPEVGASWPAPPRYYREPLRPPPPPIEGETRVYGVTQPPLGSPAPQSSLEDQVYPADTTQPIAELRKLNRSLLNSFLELLQVMQTGPKEYDAKIADIRTLLLNLQHLANSFRPHQAREDLIAEMEAQLHAKRELVDELRDACTDAEQLGVDDAGLIADTLGADTSAEAVARQPADDDLAADRKPGSDGEALLQLVSTLQTRQ